MKTVITIEVHHDRPIQHLADMVAGRAWNINGVNRAEVVPAEVVGLSVKELQAAGFTSAEIALGCTDVVRRS